MTKSAKSGRRRRKVPPRKFFEFTRVEAIKYLLGKRRVSGAAVGIMAEYTRASTWDLYQAKWKGYQDWCRKREVDPLYAPIHRFVDFLVGLRNRRHLSVSAIQGYRAALSPIFAFTDPKMHDSTEINLLVKAF